MDAEFDNVLEHLKKMQPFLYFPSSGNGGDALISHATFEFFHRHGLEYRFYSEENYQTCKNVVIRGGGGFLDGYRTMANMIEKIAVDAESVCVLPTSCHGYEKTLAQMDERFCIVARDLVSADHASRHTSGAKIMLCHDMAFILKPSDFTKLLSVPLLLRGQRLDYQLKWLLRRLKVTELMKDIPSETWMLRVDCESKRDSTSLPERNYDVSHLVKGRVDTVVRTAAISDVFYHIISSQKRIVTDRLHISICAGISGIPCQLKANNYHKNQAIYEYSIGKYYPCVEFLKAD